MEEIVLPETITRDPFKTTVPCHLVSCVTKIPFGAHPCASHGYYNYDEEHLRYYVNMAKDRQTYQEYLDRYVYGAADIGEYMEKAGGVQKLLQLRLN